jgi:Na+-transporting methylmalonyl-CoA/oxaloacetate decarboxylase beta subunit
LPQPHRTRLWLRPSPWLWPSIRKLAAFLIVLAIKLVNLFTSEKINPLVGAAALGLVPDAAHMVQVLCRQKDPYCNIYPHALASCQAALITASLTAGLLWGILGGG